MKLQQCKKCGRETEFYKMSNKTCEHCLVRDAFQAEKWSIRREFIGLFLLIGFILLLLFAY